MCALTITIIRKQGMRKKVGRFSFWIEKEAENQNNPFIAS